MADYGLPNACNCCAPICPNASIEIQSKYINKAQCGIKNTAISNALWNGSLYEKSVQTIIETYNEDFHADVVAPQANPSTWTITNTKAFDVNGSCVTTSTSEGFDQTFYVFPTAQPVPVITNTSITENYTNPSTGSREDETIFSEQATNAGLEDAVDAHLNNASWVGGGDASFSVSYSENASGPTPYYSSLSKGVARYRLNIPEGTNTYMKYVVEETFTPEDHDPQNPELSPKVVTEKTITWTGPGTPGDADTWATSWQTLETSDLGTKSVALVKYQCYTGGNWIYS